MERGTSEDNLEAEPLGKRPQTDLLDLPSEADVQVTAGAEDAPLPRKKLKVLLQERLAGAPSVIIDCDFADIQSDKDLRSMVTQISECVGINSKSNKPFQLKLTGVHTKLYDKLSKQ